MVNNAFVGEVVNIDGRIFMCAEVFRALGTTWVRYVKQNNYHLDKMQLAYVESQYATIAEWTLWVA